MERLYKRRILINCLFLICYSLCVVLFILGIADVANMASVFYITSCSILAVLIVIMYSILNNEKKVSILLDNIVRKGTDLNNYEEALEQINSIKISNINVYALQRRIYYNALLNLHLNNIDNAKEYFKELRLFSRHMDKNIYINAVFCCILLANNTDEYDMLVKQYKSKKFNPNNTNIKIYEALNDFIDGDYTKIKSLNTKIGPIDNIIKNL